MRAFPLFQVVYTPKQKCKLHSVIKEKIEAQERAVVNNSSTLLDQEDCMIDMVDDCAEDEDQ